MTGNYLLIRLGRTAIAGIFASVTIGAIVDKQKSGERSVVIHVVEPDVEVRVDDVTYPIVGTVYDPIECQLPVGGHRLVMCRGDEVLLDEPFEVEPGRDVVLTAWRRP
jgi:hypothetical protein